MNNITRQKIEAAHQHETNVLSNLANIVRSNEKYQDIQIIDGQIDSPTDATVFIFPSYNTKLDKLYNFIDSWFNCLPVIAGYEDEWTYCCNCYKAIHTTPSYYGDTPEYTIVNNCEVICLECLSEDPDEMINHYQNRTDIAISHQWVEEIFEKAGFQCAENSLEFCKIYQSGFYQGMTDTPETALQDIYDEIGQNLFDQKYNYVFSITDAGQFHVNFKLLIQEKGDN